MGGRHSGSSSSTVVVNLVMKRLGAAITDMEMPAVEKLAEEQKADPFQVLIATMLSAQTKDAVTSQASARLFKRAHSVQDMNTLSVREIEKLIYPVSFYRNKARNVKRTCHLLISRFGGVVPSDMVELVSLPGVGRKTANLVLIVSLRSTSSICVDTHVHRISNRLGWVKTRTPDKTETALYDVSPRRWWALLNKYLVTWGQNVCRPVYPICGRCAISDLCPRVGGTRVGH